MNSLIYFLLALFTLAYLWLKRRFSFWTRKGIPQIDGSFPFGSLKGVGSSVTSYELLDKFYQKFKGKEKFVGFYAFFSPNLLILDPDLVKEILTREFPSFGHRGMYYNKKDDPTSAK